MILVPHKPKPNPKRKRTNEENKDRFYDLPDCIIHHILSFLNTKHVFQTCVFSKRWNHLTKHIPTLSLCSTEFNSLDSFTKSVSRILSVRDDSTPLQTLDFDDKVVPVETQVFKSIVGYAVSHHVRILRITITYEIKKFPSDLFSSQTLTSLDLYVHPYRKLLFPNSLNLPVLTTLAVRFFYFGGHGDVDGCVDPFSVFNKLNTLIIEDIRLLDDAQILCISSTTLVNLTMEVYRFCNGEIDIFKLSTPSLCNFALSGPLNQKPWRSNLSSVEHFYMDVSNGLGRPVEDDSAALLSWLAELSNVKSLALSSNTLQVLSFAPDLFKLKLSSLCNLESLQVKMKPLAPQLYMPLKAKFIKEEGVKFYFKTDVFIPNGVVEFLLQNSPTAKLDII